MEKHFKNTCGILFCFIQLIGCYANAEMLISPETIQELKSKSYVPGTSQNAVSAVPVTAPANGVNAAASGVASNKTVNVGHQEFWKNAEKADSQQSVKSGSSQDEAPAVKPKVAHVHKKTDSLKTESKPHIDTLNDTVMNKPVQFAPPVFQVAPQPAIVQQPAPSALNPIVYVKEGMTEMIKISKGALNRIVLPFANPKTLTVNAAISKCDEGAKSTSVLCTDQNSMFVATSENSPISVFVTDGTSNQRAISITLIPVENIFPRDVKIVLSDDNGMAPVNISGALHSFSGNERSADGFERGLPYVQMITKMLKDIAQGQIPPGYSLSEVRDVSMADCQIQGTRTHLAQVLEGSSYLVNVYYIENISGSQMLINEQSCYANGVVAAAAWPRVVLDEKEATELYVVSRRNAKTEQNNSSFRPVLVNY